jgi:hypothetical protein
VKADRFTAFLLVIRVKVSIISADEIISPITGRDTPAYLSEGCGPHLRTSDVSPSARQRRAGGKLFGLLRDCSGKSVLHCPYCHGFEYGGQRLGVLQTMPMSAHQALLIADWRLTTLYLNGGECRMPRYRRRWRVAT